MNRTILILAILLAAGLLTSCGDAAGPTKPANTIDTTSTPVADPNADHAEIRRLVTETAIAFGRNDASALGRLYAPDHRSVNVDGSTMNRAESLDAITSGNLKYSSFSYPEVNVTIEPGGGQAIVHATASVSGTVKGKPFDGSFDVTQAWSKSAEGWRMTSNEMRRQKAGGNKDRPANNVSPSDAMPMEKAPAHK